MVRKLKELPEVDFPESFSENIMNLVSAGAHSRERTSARPPLGRATALPPHGANPPGSSRDANARAQPAREKPARDKSAPKKPHEHVTRRQPRVQSTKTWRRAPSTVVAALVRAYRPSRGIRLRATTCYGVLRSMPDTHVGTPVIGCG
ncbi:unnamed protein product, partial [Iphiclides podalirius]